MNASPRLFALIAAALSGLWLSTASTASPPAQAAAASDSQGRAVAGKPAAAAMARPASVPLEPLGAGKRVPRVTSGGTQTEDTVFPGKAQK